MTTRSAPTGVLYLANSALIGGGNRALMDLMRGLDRSRFQPVLVSPAAGPLVEWAAGQGIPCRVMPMDGTKLGMLRQAWTILRLIRRFGVRLMHANSPDSYRIPSIPARLAGVPRVVHLQFPPDAEQLRWNFRSGPEAVVTCYEGQAGEVRPVVREIQPAAKVLAVPNSVDVTAFTPESQPGDAAFRFGATEVVLILGHLSEVKGYPTFIEAAARIAAQRPGVAFVALGGETVDVGARARYEALAREKRVNVHFLGWRPEVASIIRAADVVVLPSLVEGLPLSVLEAMACGRPVVATAVNGTPEAVEHGVTGLLIAPRDPAMLSDAVLSLLNDDGLRARMGQAGRQRVVERFSNEIFVRRMQALYGELIGGQAG